MDYVTVPQGLFIDRQLNILEIWAAQTPFDIYVAGSAHLIDINPSEAVILLSGRHRDFNYESPSKL